MLWTFGEIDLEMFGSLLELSRPLKTFVFKDTGKCEKRNLEISDTCQLRAKM